LFCYVSGHFTLADIYLISTFTAIVACEAFDLTKFGPELNLWLEKCKAHIPNYEKVGGKGAALIGQSYKDRIAAHRFASVSPKQK
jgi:hypothetical protein